MRFVNSLPFLAAIPLVHGWSELGHRTVAYLAQKYLTDEASKLVNSLLENDQGYDISDAALWADSIKRRPGYTHTAVWHYIDAADNPPETCNVNYRRDCKRGPGCIVSAITNFTARVTNINLDAKQQKEALMFLIHFIGDIHQPLHTELLDRGGNDIHVRFDSRNPRDSLHGIWDKDILHKMRDVPGQVDDTVIKDAASSWASDLFTVNSALSARQLAAECKDVGKAEQCALVWAGEANLHICDTVLKNGTDWVKKNDLGGDYFLEAVPVVNELVAKAGLRLGNWLNGLAVTRQSAGQGFIVQDNERMEM